MKYGIKKARGRPKVDYKIRNLNAITPKGYVLHKVSSKNKQAVYKRVY